MDITCPTCQSANRPEARFCSTCGASLSTEEEAAQVTAGLPPDPAPAATWQPPPPPPTPVPPGDVPAEPVPRRSRTPLWIALGVGAAVVLAAVLWLVLRDEGATISFPETIAGQPRLTSQTYQGIAEAIADQEAFGPNKPLIAIYGTEASPALMVFAFDSVPSGVPPAGFFDMFVSGFEGSGGSIDRSSVTTEVRGATTYNCASYTAPPIGGSVCTWLDAQTLGVVMTLDQSLSAGVDLAAQVHDAAVS